MTKLFQVEWMRVRYSSKLWLFFGVYALLGFVAMNMVHSVNFNGNAAGPTALQFPNVWEWTAYVLKFGDWFLVLTLLWYLARDYAQKVMRQDVINGLSPAQWLHGKLLFVLMVLAITSVYKLILGGYFGVVSTPDEVLASPLSNIHFIGFSALALSLKLAAAVLLVNLTRQAMFAFLAYIGLYLAEGILTWVIGDAFGAYLPLELVSGLMPFPAHETVSVMTGMEFSQLPVGISLVLGLTYIGLFAAASYVLVSKRDL